jgi:DNA-directed RNA polymerase specialized sigma24 family protein
LSSSGPEAWQTFIGVYHPQVAMWCRETKLSPTDVDDVSQNVFTSVLTSIIAFQKKTAALTLPKYKSALNETSNRPSTDILSNSMPV